MSEVEIVIDGSCLGNPVPEVGRASFGAVKGERVLRAVGRGHDQ